MKKNVSYKIDINFRFLILTFSLISILLIKNFNSINVNYFTSGDNVSPTLTESCKYYPNDKVFESLEYEKIIMYEQISLFPEIRNISCINKVSKVELESNLLLIYQYKSYKFVDYFSKVIFLIYLIVLLQIKKFNFYELFFVLINLLIVTYIFGLDNYVNNFFIYSIILIFTKVCNEINFMKFKYFKKFYKTFYENYKTLYFLALIFMSFFVGGWLSEEFVPEGGKIGLSKQITEMPHKLFHSYYATRDIENLSNEILSQYNLYITINEHLESNILEIFNDNKENFNIICDGKKIELPECLYKHAGKNITIPEGEYYTDVIDIYSGTNLIISKNASIHIKDDINWSQYCLDCENGVGAVIRAVGTLNEPLRNINILLEGNIVGSSFAKKNGHRYEGINFKYVELSSISGDGSISNINGDGIDIDSSSNIIIKDVSISNNSGTGVHLGSPRPISSSQNIIVKNVTSSNNGHLLNRSGFDNSWPNVNSLFLVNNIAIDNFQNFDIQGYGVIMINNKSLGSVQKQDFLNGAFENYNFLSDFVISTNK